MASAKRPFYVFPYREEEELVDAVRETTQRILRPTLDIEVTHGEFSQRVRALVDTGAPRCLFPKGIGDILKVDFGGNRPRYEVKILGQHRHVVRADVVLGVPNAPELWWNTEASFFDFDWDDIRLGVLGNLGFLDRCVVSFHRSKNQFIIESIEDWEARIPPDPLDEFLKHGGDPDWERPRQD